MSNMSVEIPLPKAEDCLPTFDADREKRLRGIANEQTDEPWFFDSRIGHPNWTMFMRELLAEIDRLRGDQRKLAAAQQGWKGYATAAELDAISRRALELEPAPKFQLSRMKDVP